MAARRSEGLAAVAAVAAVPAVPAASRVPGEDAPAASRSTEGRGRSREVLTFLAVGGLGYVVDVALFNLLISGATPLSTDPKLAKVGSVALAMVVTYLGNRYLTWRHRGGRARSREVALFVVFNLVGMGFSVLALLVSHDLLRLTSRLADNLSANVVGLLLGTAFRYWAYQRYVFSEPAPTDADAPPVAAS